MLAIVIPYYKLIFFEETLKSLSAQTDKRFRVYIGNDASPEDPSLLLEEYKDKIDFVYQLFEENLGGASLAKHWERCIALVKDEDWIMILGDDDVLENNVVESWYKHYNIFNTKSNLVRFASKSFNMNLNGRISDSFINPEWEKASDSYFRRFKGLTRSSLSEYAFSKTVFKKYGFFDFPLAWHSDDAAWLFFSDDKLIYSINESNLLIRYSSSSISGKQNNQKLKDIASEKFYSQCITKKIELFNKSQQLDLILEYEIAIKKNRKLRLAEWRYLLLFYLSSMQINAFFKCLRRFCLSFKS
ncbi:glycosyltransferase family 2 protein [Flavobacterium chilense]|uniref:Glycosyl transferase family 2 n=1 Tax=Flavobacterium chilense TaxID=946677 RepID=A0A1M7GQ42_9FLAO|nr:glycosyltransferase family 2 protein [Flavobacterium chilense]SHM18472.1 Glycosyl transferase family 2 [Flavobacterium chilense]